MVAERLRERCLCWLFRHVESRRDLIADACRLIVGDCGKILLNTKKSIDDERVITIDGDSIAEKYLGFPITNTILLGALAAVSGLISLNELTDAVKQTMPPRLHEKNIAAVKAAFEEAGK